MHFIFEKDRFSRIGVDRDISSLLNHFTLVVHSLNLVQLGYDKVVGANSIFYELSLLESDCECAHFNILILKLIISIY